MLKSIVHYSYACMYGVCLVNSDNSSGITCDPTVQGQTALTDHCPLSS